MKDFFFVCGSVKKTWICIFTSAAYKAQDKKTSVGKCERYSVLQVLKTSLIPRPLWSMIIWFIQKKQKVSDTFNKMYVCLLFDHQNQRTSVASSIFSYCVKKRLRKNIWKIDSIVLSILLKVWRTNNDQLYFEK